MKRRYFTNGTTKNGNNIITSNQRKQEWTLNNLPTPLVSFIYSFLSMVDHMAFAQCASFTRSISLWLTSTPRLVCVYASDSSPVSGLPTSLLRFQPVACHIYPSDKRPRSECLSHSTEEKNQSSDSQSSDSQSSDSQSQMKRCLCLGVLEFTQIATFLPFLQEVYVGAVQPPLPSTRLLFEPLTSLSRLHTFVCEHGDITPFLEAACCCANCPSHSEKKKSKRPALVHIEVHRDAYMTPRSLQCASSQLQQLKVRNYQNSNETNSYTYRNSAWIPVLLSFESLVHLDIQWVSDLSFENLSALSHHLSNLVSLQLPPIETKVTIDFSTYLPFPSLQKVSGCTSVAFFWWPPTLSHLVIDCNWAYLGWQHRDLNLKWQCTGLACLDLNMHPPDHGIPYLLSREIMDVSVLSNVKSLCMDKSVASLRSFTLPILRNLETLRLSDMVLTFPYELPSALVHLTELDLSGCSSRVSKAFYECGKFLPSLLVLRFARSLSPPPPPTTPATLVLEHEVLEYFPTLLRVHSSYSETDNEYHQLKLYCVMFRETTCVYPHIHSRCI